MLLACPLRRLTHRRTHPPSHTHTSPRSNGVAWDFTSCSFDNFNGWADAADRVLRAQGVNLDAYKYRMYLTPPGLCPWAGLGYVGCPDDSGWDCRSWIGGGFWGAPQAIAHELGEPLGAGLDGLLGQRGACAPRSGLARAASPAREACCPSTSPRPAHARAHLVTPAPTPPGHNLFMDHANKLFTQTGTPSP